MTFWERISSLLGFRTIPTTVLVVLSYVAIIISLLVTDELPAVPGNQKGLDLKQAYEDLQNIAARPHPYNSHANDIVHDYILTRLTNLATHHPHVHVVNDITTNVSWATGRAGSYFEGTNVLVKVDGTDPKYANEGGVLFSAHYDSVSTAPGATDDAMGVATLMQLVSYFAERRPRRTVVFNINNGEEDGLYGAHAFLQHPWSNITSTFLNLEGASSGGRPLLFRATSPTPLRAFLRPNVPHPHANVLSADAFSRGVVRSGTDYTVYAAPPYAMEGLDLAFYKGRSRYHTKFDAVPYTVGRERSLWSMMEAAKGAGVALANADAEEKNGDGGGKPVYFDLFAAFLIVFPLRTLFTIDILLLILGPLILILILVIDHISRRSPAQRQNGHATPTAGGSSNIFHDAWTWFSSFRWARGAWMWGKFWVALVLSVALQVGLVVGYMRINPYIMYSSPYLVLVSSFSLAYITLTTILRLPLLSPYPTHSHPNPHSQHAHAHTRTRTRTLPEQQKQTTLLQTYILTWLLLLLSTLAAGSAAQIGGGYFITLWNAAVLVACAVGCVEDVVRAHGTAGEAAAGGVGPPPQGDRLVHFEGEGVGGEGAAVVDVQPSDEGDEGATEETPLIRHQHQQQRGGTRTPQKEEEAGAVGWWILQLLLVIPVPVILIGHLGLILVGAMAQTLTDGSSPALVYAGASLIAIGVTLPLAPFSFKIHKSVTYLMIVVFILSTVYTWIVFPFPEAVPMKVHFQQKLFLSASSSSSASDSERAVTVVTGLERYLKKGILPSLPSSHNRPVKCYPEEARPGLWSCEWESGLVPYPGGRPFHTSSSPSATQWLRAGISKTGALSAQITLQGRNTRNCRVYFDSEPIMKYNISGGDDTMQAGFRMPETGVSILKLWSRSWEREFVVDVEWGEEPEKAQAKVVSGRFACEWAEYESATVGVDAMEERGRRAKIPALEEVLAFMPSWAAVLKQNDGLVEVTSPFSLEL